MAAVACPLTKSAVWLPFRAAVLSIVADGLKLYDQIFWRRINLLEDRIHFLSGDGAIDLKGAPPRVLEKFRIGHGGLKACRSASARSVERPDGAARASIPVSPASNRSPGVLGGFGLYGSDAAQQTTEKVGARNDPLLRTPDQDQIMLDHVVLRSFRYNLHATDDVA
jgi:hypothetical protein